MLGNFLAELTETRRWISERTPLKHSILSRILHSHSHTQSVSQLRAWPLVVVDAELREGPMPPTGGGWDTNLLPPLSITVPAPAPPVQHRPRREMS